MMIHINQHIYAENTGRSYKIWSERWIKKTQYNILLYHHILIEVWINVSATKQCANETQSGRKTIKYEDSL
jgi:hypothetical protein